MASATRSPKWRISLPAGARIGSGHQRANGMTVNNQIVTSAAAFALLSLHAPTQQIPRTVAYASALPAAMASRISPGDPCGGAATDARLSASLVGAGGPPEPVNAALLVRASTLDIGSWPELPARENASRGAVDPSPARSISAKAPASKNVITTQLQGDSHG